MIVSTDKLVEAWERIAVVGSWEPNDSRYAIASDKWWSETFPWDLLAFYQRNRMSDYVENRRDCDKFALAAVLAAQLAHMQSTAAEAALACGTVNYTTNNGTRHQIVWHGRLDGGERLAIGFFEPQLQNAHVVGPVKLSRQEIGSITQITG